MSDSLVVNEIYRSLQGESSHAGLPCIFVRLTGCNLRCAYCDSAYAFTEGRRQDVADVVARVRELAADYGVAWGERRLPLIELTGGEPLLQTGSFPLLEALCDDGFTVLVETSGAVDISRVDPRVHRIVDLKCPGSGEVDRNRWQNLARLQGSDEVKFVIGFEEDYAWMKELLIHRQLQRRCPVLVSWASPLPPQQRDPSLKPVPPGLHPISCRTLAERVVADALPVRFQLQLHKHIWPPDQRGV